MKDYSNMINQPIQVSQETFFHSLKFEGLIESYSNGSSTRNTKRFVNKDKDVDVSLLVINKQVFANFLKTMYGDDK